MDQLDKKTASMSSEQKRKRMEELKGIDRKQSHILEKQTGVGLYPKVEMKDGTIIIYDNDKTKRQLFNI
ncbi:hypothetical protein CR203_18875 [Salipaludibacillus neizhouensis]|uniref:Uncharacterized protein n=1 Tax=Salipaludibacillus neizhouensis TaxID=885475 RepID=A0A3A9K5I3_9BACI|nr:hypothetical protein [Salipaludibacillus neizhouensis]RKL65722.1 hypothetical protein CR203_18875 [Salipaludibacillus neizhouensis]